MEPADQAAPPPKRRRRRWLIIAFVLVLVSTVSWWYWPRGDARFVGRWEWGLSEKYGLGVLVLEANGILKQYRRDGSFAATRQWTFDGEVLTETVASTPSWLVNFMGDHRGPVDQFFLWGDQRRRDEYRVISLTPQTMIWRDNTSRRYDHDQMYLRRVR